MRTFGWSPSEEELKDLVNVIDQVGELHFYLFEGGSAYSKHLKGKAVCPAVTLLYPVILFGPDMH